MNYLIFILLGLAAIAGTGNGFIIGQNKTNRKRRISDGHPICIEKVPYQVYLKGSGDYICGGALIRPNIVLTAAHCLQDVNLAIEQLPQLFVVAGTDSTTLKNNEAKATGSITIQAKDFIIHPEYDPKSKEADTKYDLAIIQLLRKFPKTDKISPIKISTVDVEEDDELTISGIGRLNEYSPSPCLNAFKTKVINCTAASSILEFTLDNNEGVICHKNPSKHRCRKGDSGGPMVNSEGQLVGIVTGWHEVICLQSLLELWFFETGINVVYHSNWIKQMIENYDKNSCTLL